MDHFIGRHQELRVLENAWTGESSGFIPIYGRRRIGKSELILRFAQGKPALYFVGKTAPAALQIREFLGIAATVFDEPLLAGYQATGWADALDTVLERKPADQKLLLAFDEFQWMAEASPELPSILQERWDRRWKSSGDILLIVCGSYIGFMEREVLGRKSPLFGRRTAQILLQPFGYREAGEFLPAYSLVDKARAYFVCGGVPYYLQEFTDRESIESNLVARILDEHAVLHREPDFLLREELREVDSYYAILLAVASGAGSTNEISRVSGIVTSSLPYYLKQLLELGYLARRHPLTGAKTRAVRYDLRDPLLRFWFRFVFPEQSRIARLGPRRAVQELLKPRLAGYFGFCFERLCREALPLLYEREGVDAGCEIGEYWAKDVQVDVVGLRDDGWTDLGECKWGAVRSPGGLEKELEAKVARYPNRRGATIGRRLFVRGPAPTSRSTSPSVRWHTLDDLYA